MNNNQKSIYNLEFSELNHHLHLHLHVHLSSSSKSTHSAIEIFKLLYHVHPEKGLLWPKKFENAKGLVSQKKIDDLQEEFTFNLPTIIQTIQSPDGTIKFLLKLQDEKQIETVLIPFAKKYTVCLSSQVGCALKCSFCYTGTQGLSRNLEAYEIVGQYLIAWDWLIKNKPDKMIKPNVVFMGQGEPLHNFDQVKKAITILTTKEGLFLGPRQITLSTAGFLPGLKRFSEFPQINLAVSLHSAFNETRTKLIPINKIYPIEDLFLVLENIPLKKRQFINFEYLLLSEINDTEEDAIALAKLIKRTKSIVNLIPFNEYPGQIYKRPDQLQIENFRGILQKAGIFTWIRTTKGSEILAACGQLVGKKVCH